MKITREIDKSELISVDEVKLHLRILSDDQNVVLESCIKSAIVASENYINSPIYFSEYICIDKYSPVILLPYNDSKVKKVILLDDPLSVLSNKDSTVEFSQLGPYLSIDNPNRLPYLSITLSAGYTKDTLPEDIKAAIMMQAGALFQNPVDAVETLPKASQNLLNPYRRLTI